MDSTNISYWEEALKNLPDSYKKWFSKEKEYLTKTITKDAKVLEVGCGDGRSLIDIIPITKNITGIDHDKKAVDDAREKIKNYSQADIILADAGQMPFEDDSFDFVICMTTFANFGEAKFQILNEMKRVLKKDGFIIISVYAENALEERIKLYKINGVYQKIKEINGTTVIFEETVGDNISEQFSKEELIEIFNKTKLKIKEINKSEIAYICKLSK